MDLFEKYLKKKEESELVKRALTDRLFKKEYLSKNKIEYKEKTNEDLATYGDAVIKLGYSEILFDKEEKLSEVKAKLESDEFFVTVIAKHYELLDYIRIDSYDDKIKKDYVYQEAGKTESGKYKKKNPRKYIATAVEAMIGAIYIEEG